MFGTNSLSYLKDNMHLIRTKFGVEYSENHVRRLLKSFRMEHSKSYRVELKEN